ncbi:PREDICTED: small nuclear ribonucleoprotein F [Charadrius vociferus]|uniref:small nuclear ribonucleoprotein F n=1 Tax=Charadrius vociferus TaxID=50402 RepID=UPI0005217415|nr:PREDICTED: small nuclear ribonucleoprotein F [Charadrius vociferus]
MALKAGKSRGQRHATPGWVGHAQHRSDVGRPSRAGRAAAALPVRLSRQNKLAAGLRGRNRPRGACGTDRWRGGRKPGGRERPTALRCALANTEEYIDGALSGHLGEVLIRCNNVLYIRGVEEEEEDGEMRE